MYSVGPLPVLSAATGNNHLLHHSHLHYGSSQCGKLGFKFVLQITKQSSECHVGQTNADIKTDWIEF